MHLYFFDADSGAQFTDLKELTVNLSLPAKDIGPIEAELERSGPGHYVAPSAPFGVPGDWDVDVGDAGLQVRAGRGRARGTDRMTHTLAAVIVALAPLAALVGMLICGRYPGERVLMRVRRWFEPPAHPKPAAPVHPHPVIGAWRPRGSALLAANLAGRAPPSVRWIRT